MIQDHVGAEGCWGYTYLHAIAEGRWPRSQVPVQLNAPSWMLAGEVRLEVTMCQRSNLFMAII